MKKIYTFILMLFIIAFSVKSQEWNISSAEFNSLGVVSKDTVINGLTIYAHSGKTIEIDANNKSLDGMDFTHRLKLGGVGDFDENGKALGRVVGIQVTGNTKITVMSMSSSSSEDRQLNLAIGHKDSIAVSFPALGTALSKGEYNYTGGSNVIYLYSPSSGVNIYYLKAEPEQTARVWNITSADFNALGVISETTTVNGLTIWANTEKTIEIDANAKSLDGMDFTHRLKLGGAGDFDENGLPLGRVLSVELSGNARITVMGMSSSSSTDRSLILALNHKDSVFATFPALGTPITKGEYVYEGDSATLFFYSPSSGVNIYYLKVEDGWQENEALEGEWNISSAEFNALGILSDTTVVNGLTIYAHSGKTVEIDANNKTLDEVNYTHRLKLGGAGEFSEDGQPLGRVLAIDVSGNTTLTVAGMSSSSGENRVLNIAVGHKDSIMATFPALGEELTKGEFNYFGGPATIYLYSPSSGVNIYYLKTSELTTSVRPVISTNQQVRIFPNPATDKVFIGVNKPTRVAIYNLSGAMVKSQMVLSEYDYINVSDLNPGMYLIRSQMSREFSQKLMVK